MKKPSAYKVVYDSLVSDIKDKLYSVGDFFPPEPELCNRFDVSRTTIRRAIELLSQKGYIKVKQGYGTQVISRVSTQNLNRLTSITKTLESKGHIVELKNYSIDTVYASKEIADLFSIPYNSELICIFRVLLADTTPIAIMKNYILPSIVPNILDFPQPITKLYSYLEKKHAIVYSNAKDIITACNATFEESALLEVEHKKALIHVKRLCYLGQTVSEVDIIKLLPEKYEFEINMLPN